MHARLINISINGQIRPETWVGCVVCSLYILKINQFIIYIVTQILMIYINFFIKEISGDNADDRNRELRSSETVPIQRLWNETGWNGK